MKRCDEYLKSHLFLCLVLIYQIKFDLVFTDMVLIWLPNTIVYNGIMNNLMEAFVCMIKTGTRQINISIFKLIGLRDFDKLPKLQ